MSTRLTGPARRVTVVVGTLAVLAGGCADRPPARDTPDPAPTTTVSTSPAPEGEPVRVTGMVVDGVEPGCLLLATGKARYLLLGGNRDRLAPERRVTVTGYAEPGAPTTCMEGIPLTVTGIAAAG